MKKLSSKYLGDDIVNDLKLDDQNFNPYFLASIESYDILSMFQNNKLDLVEFSKLPSNVMDMILSNQQMTAHLCNKENSLIEILELVEFLQATNIKNEDIQGANFYDLINLYQNVKNEFEIWMNYKINIDHIIEYYKQDEKMFIFLAYNAGIIISKYKELVDFEDIIKLYQSNQQLLEDLVNSPKLNSHMAKITYIKQEEKTSENYASFSPSSRIQGQSNSVTSTPFNSLDDNVHCFPRIHSDLSDLSENDSDRANVSNASNSDYSDYGSDIDNEDDQLEGLSGEMMRFEF